MRMRGTTCNGRIVYPHCKQSMIIARHDNEQIKDGRGPTEDEGGYIRSCTVPRTADMTPIYLLQQVLELTAVLLVEGPDARPLEHLESRLLPVLLRDVVKLLARDEAHGLEHRHPLHLQA